MVGNTSILVLRPIHFNTMATLHSRYFECDFFHKNCNVFFLWILLPVGGPIRLGICQNRYGLTLAGYQNGKSATDPVLKYTIIWQWTVDTTAPHHNFAQLRHKKTATYFCLSTHIFQFNVNCRHKVNLGSFHVDYITIIHKNQMSTV